MKKQSFKIANESDKDKFFEDIYWMVEKAIFKELINKQNDHLNIEIRIEAIRNEE